MLQQLLELGLDPREARFYLAVLSEGRTTVSRAARLAQVSRPSGYDLARRLEAKGYLQEIEFGSDGRRDDRTRSELVARDPSTLFEEVDRRRGLLNELVPQLRAIQSTARSGPRVRYLEGVSGIRDALFETLAWPSPIRGVLSMRDLLTVPGKDAMEEYIAERRRRGLTLYVVRSPERDIPWGWPTSAEDLRYARYAPPQYVFTMTTIVGADAVAVMSSRAEGFAMMIESREFAETQASLFELLWAASSEEPVR